MSRSIKGKVCFVKDTDLGIKNTKPGKGHYVYVSDVDKVNNTCTVHTFTSLEREAITFDRRSKTYKYSFYNDRLSKVRSDMILILAFDKREFSRWTGITSNGVSNLSIDSLQNIGCRTLSNNKLASIDRFLKNKPTTKK